MRPQEYGAVGELTAAVYVDDGLVAAGSGYVATLRDTGRRAGLAEVLVAVEGGAVLGTVTFAPGGTDYAERSGPGEAEFRMLAVDPAARGRGIGERLVAECVRLSRAAGAGALRLSTPPGMAAAHRLYERLGFSRTPERDWSPNPGYLLLTYALDLGYCDHCGRELAAGGHEACRAARELDPPRWCGRCRRRMVVQVTPTGWTARCVEHGELAG